MAYTSQSEIEAAIPAPHLVDATDDDRDGAADFGVIETVIQVACTAVDSYLASVYTVPFPDPAPAAVKDAAFVFACELIYQRRPHLAESNPFKAQADAWRTRLKDIGDGKASLDANQPRTFKPGAAITEPVDVDGTTR
jgi:phage gp36-like protein